MKKVVILTFLLSSFAAITSVTPVVYSEELTITTYYPSPYGVYNTLRLYPNDNQSPGDGCANEGELTYSLSAHKVLVCNGRFWSWIGSAHPYIYKCFTIPGKLPECVDSGDKQGYCPKGFIQAAALGSCITCQYGRPEHPTFYWVPPGGSCADDSRHGYEVPSGESPLAFECVQ